MIHFLLFLFCSLEISAFRTGITSSAKPSSFLLYQIHPVRVYDHVFSSNSLQIVDDQAKACGLGHTVYHRKNKPRTSVEEAIESVLVSLHDESPMVEYWWREEWMNLEFHR